MAEILVRRIKMVKGESGYAFRISTDHAGTAFICNRLLLEFFPPFIDEKLSLAFDAAKPASFSNLD
jgi:hypothetical protein